MLAESVIVITGINLARSGRDGRRIIAHFDFEISGAIQFRGCALLRTEKDGLSVALPQPGTQRAQRGVSIIDQSLGSAVTFAARQAYKKLGGTDLPEWAMRAATGEVG